MVTTGQSLPASVVHRVSWVMQDAAPCRTWQDNRSLQAQRQGQPRVRNRPMAMHVHHNSLRTLGVQAGKAFKTQVSGSHQERAQHGGCAGAWSFISLTQGWMSHHAATSRRRELWDCQQSYADLTPLLCCQRRACWAPACLCSLCCPMLPLENHTCQPKPPQASPSPPGKVCVGVGEAVRNVHCVPVVRQREGEGQCVVAAPAAVAGQTLLVGDLTARPEPAPSLQQARDMPGRPGWLAL